MFFSEPKTYTAPQSYHVGRPKSCNALRGNPSTNRPDKKMTYITTTLSRYDKWMNFCDDCGMYIDARGILFMWAVIPLKYKSIIETQI